MLCTMLQNKTESVWYWRPECATTTEPKLTTLTYFLVEKDNFPIPYKSAIKQAQCPEQAVIAYYITHTSVFTSDVSTKCFRSQPFTVGNCYRSVLTMSE